MFWRKKATIAPAVVIPGAAAATSASATEVKTKAPKVKKLSPKETMINQIQQLIPEQVITYKLAKLYWENFAGFMLVELNPQYPQKGRKYIVSVDKIADDKPAGKKTFLWNTNKAEDIVSAVLDRGGVFLS